MSDETPTKLTPGQLADIKERAAVAAKASWSESIARLEVPLLLRHIAALEAELDRMRAAIASLAAFIEKDIVQGDAPTIEQGEEWVRLARAEAAR